MLSSTSSDRGDAAASTSTSTVTANKKPEPTTSSAKPSYATLNINDLYRGKSLEQSKTPAPRHGMQTLGKVVRRNQTSGAPTGLTASSEADCVTSNSVASGGPISQVKQSGSEAASNPNPGSLTGSSLSSSSSGWATVSSTNSSGAVSTAAHPGRDQSLVDPVSSQSKPGTGTRPQSNSSSIGPAAQSTPWTGAAPVTQPVGPQGPTVRERSFADQSRSLGKGPLLPAQEFPELGVEEVPASKPTDSRSSVEPGPYGPGPSLRPATSANWSQGSANAAAAILPAYGTSGGVNGSQTNDKSQQQQQQLGATPASQSFGGPAATGNGVAGGTYRGTGGQSAQRSVFPGGGGQTGDFRSNRSKFGKDEPPVVKFNASIMPDEKISEFDEILEKGDIRHDWTAICDAIDYDQDLNFDLDDSALDAAFKTMPTPAPVSEPPSTSSTISSAVDVQSTGTTTGRKLHSFEDEFTRSPPNSGRVLYDPRDQRQHRTSDNRQSGQRSRRTSEKSDDVHSEGRGGAVGSKSQTLGRNGVRGQAPDLRDAQRSGYKQQPLQQQTQLPPRFQKQLQQQQQQQNHSQSQPLPAPHHQNQTRIESRFDARPDGERHNRDGAVPPHHQSHGQEWRSQPSSGSSQRNSARPSASSASAPSAADEMDWRSASKRVPVNTDATTNRSSDSRGTGISSDREITILRHEKGSNKRNPTRRKTPEESMTFDYRDLPPSTLSAITRDSSSKREAGTGDIKDPTHIAPQFPSQKNDRSNDRKITPASSRAPGPVVARVVHNSNYTAPAPKLAPEQKACPPDFRSKADAAPIRPQENHQEKRMVMEGTASQIESKAKVAVTQPRQQEHHSDRRTALEPKTSANESKPKTPDAHIQSRQQKHPDKKPVELRTSQNDSKAKANVPLTQTRAPQKHHSKKTTGSESRTPQNEAKQKAVDAQLQLRQEQQRKRAAFEPKAHDPKSKPTDVPLTSRPQEHHKNKRDEQQRPIYNRQDSSENNRNECPSVPRDDPQVPGSQYRSQRVREEQRPNQRSLAANMEQLHLWEGSASTSGRSSGPVLARVVHNSNYGPPPSKAAFESKPTQNDSKPKVPADVVIPMRPQEHLLNKREEIRPTYVRQESGDNSRSDSSSVPRDDGHMIANQFRNQQMREDVRPSQRSLVPNMDQLHLWDNRRPDHQNRMERNEHRPVENRADGRTASMATPPVTHPMYNMATLANLYSPAFNQHMDPRASVQLQAFAQQLAFHQTQSQHPIRTAVQAHGGHGAAPGVYAGAPQMSDFRTMGQTPAQHQHQSHPTQGQQMPAHPQQQQQQSNLMKQVQYLQQQPNFHFWNR